MSMLKSLSTFGGTGVKAAIAGGASRPAPLAAATGRVADGATALVHTRSDAARAASLLATGRMSREPVSWISGGITGAMPV